MALHFSKEEFSKRKQDVLKSMKEQNLDALLMFRQESMYWLTGYDTRKLTVYTIELLPF